MNLAKCLKAAFYRTTSVAAPKYMLLLKLLKNHKASSKLFLRALRAFKLFNLGVKKPTVKSGKCEKVTSKYCKFCK